MKKSGSPQSLLRNLVLLTGANITLLAGIALSPAAPTMLDEFHDVPGVSFWVSMMLTLPALFVVLGGSIMGYFVDRYGRKTVLTSSFLLGGLGGVSGYFLQSLPMLLVTRALVGLSVAGALTANNSLIADYFDGQARARFIGLQSAFAGLSGVVFQFLGGVLVEINWRFSFLTYLPLFVLFPLALLTIEEPPFVAAAVGETLRSKLRLTPVVLLIFAAIFLNQLTFTTVPVFLPHFLAEFFAASGIQIGLLGAGASLVSFVFGLLYERLRRSFSYWLIMIATFLLFGVGFLMLGAASSWALVILAEVVFGAFMGLSPPNLTAWLSNVVPPDVRGRANGVFITLFSLGQFATSLFFSPVAGTLGLRWIYFLCAGIIFLMVSVALLLKPRILSEVQGSSDA